MRETAIKAVNTKPRNLITNKNTTGIRKEVTLTAQTVNILVAVHQWVDVQHSTKECLTKHKQMKIKIPEKVSYDAPEGWVRGRLIQPHPIKGSAPGQEGARFTFEILYPTSGSQKIHVGKSYPADQTAKLQQDLETWMGEDITTIIDNGEYDLSKLEGKEAELELVHIRNKAYAKPYVFLKEIRPAGYRFASLN
jgi:hypothetical protein